jgi:hypothetical protein
MIMTEIGEMEDNVEKLLVDLGVEVKFLKDLREEVIKEISDIEHDDLEDAAKMSEDELKIIKRKIGRMERKIERKSGPGVKVEENIKELKKFLPPKFVEYLDNLDKKIAVGLNTMIQSLSRSKGTFKEEVNRGKLLIDQAKKLEAEKKDSKSVRAGAVEIAKKTLNHCNYVLRMILGTEADLGQYEQFLKYLEKL